MQALSAYHRHIHLSFGQRARAYHSTFCLRTALDCGNAVQHIDTAVMYGNEAEIGKAVAEHLKSGKLRREDLFVTTKLNNSMQQHSEEGVEPAIRESLEKLQLDYVDLVLIHWPVTTDRRTEKPGDVQPPIQVSQPYLLW